MKRRANYLEIYFSLSKIKCGVVGADLIFFSLDNTFWDYITHKRGKSLRGKNLLYL